MTNLVCPYGTHSHAAYRALGQAGVKPDVVVAAAGCRLDEHLEQWPTQASKEPVIPDRPEVAPEAKSTDTSH
jgi:hypothetical protein